MKIRLQQINPTIGALKYNQKLILEAIESAEKDGVELLLLPELVICGYPPMDLIEKESFRHLCYKLSDEIISATKNTAVIFGSITDNSDNLGRKCFNSAIIAQNGKEISRVHKALLPTYDVFDDLRYFEPGTHFEPIKVNGINLGVTVCEDIWFNDNEINYHTYKVNPAEILAKKGAEVIVNVSASPFTKKKPISRANMLRRHAEQLNLPVLYVNQIGAQTDLVFDGDSMAINKSGEVVGRLTRFEPDFLDINYNQSSKSLDFSSETFEAVPNVNRTIFEALKLGISDYLKKSGAAKKVILGLSGGIDSALIAVLAKEALGAENVIAVTMPSKFSSDGSVKDSEKLAENLGIKLEKIEIDPIYQIFLTQLDEIFNGTEFNVAEENLQSRSRGNLLMAIANKFGYMLLNTGNKSELAVGYCTLYGDMSGGLAPISDLYKTEVFELCKWLNEEFYKTEVIPNAILTKEPSAELRPDQKDSDSLPNYETLDAILEYYIENQLSRKEIISKGFETSVVDRILWLVDINEHKRNQAAPGLKISAKAFGTGRRWPIVQGWTGLEKELNKA